MLKAAHIITAVSVGFYVIALFGGQAVTFDFVAASAQMFADEGNAENLAKEIRWSTGVNIQTSQVRSDDPMRKAVWKGVRFLPPETDGTLRQVNGPELLKMCGGSEDFTKEVASSRTTYLPSPGASGQIVRVSFKYRSRHELGTRTFFYVGFNAPKKQGERNAKVLSTRLLSLAGTTDGFVAFHREYRIPAGAATMCLMMRFDGIGEFAFKDVCVSVAGEEPPIVLKQAAQGFFTPRFEIGEGQPGIVCWHWRQASGSSGGAPSNLRCVLTVPKEFSLDGVSFADIAKAKRRDLPDGAVEYRMPCAYYLLPKSSFNNWLRLGAAVSSKRGVGAEGDLSLHVEDAAGKRLSDTVRTRLVVTAKVKAAAVPERYVIGIVPAGPYFMTCGEAADSISAMVLDSGVRGAILHSASDATATLWHGKGAKQVVVGNSELANGFIYGPAKGRPESERFHFLGSSPHRFASVAACPISCYSESDYFKTVTVPWLQAMLRGADGFWSNWEPYHFARIGCMCDRCRAAFAAYAKVDEETLAAEWPREIAPDGKYGRRIERFRSVEHGKVVRTLARHLKRMAGPGGMGFIPGIAWPEMSSCWRTRNLAAEVQAIDYAGELDWICPWGPYVCWDTSSPYVPRRAPALVAFAAARDVRRTVDADYPAGKRPKLMGFLSGNSYGTDWIAQPEWIEVQALAQFFNGWEATYFEGFPRGYDARYWRALVRAAETAAKWEPFVAGGVRADDDVSLRCPGDATFPKVRMVSEYLPADDGMAAVQHVAWRLGGRVAVAVFNFTERDSFDVDVMADGRAVRHALRIPPCACVVTEVVARQAVGLGS